MKIELTKTIEMINAVSLNRYFCLKIFLSDSMSRSSQGTKRTKHDNSKIDEILNIS